MVKLTMRHERHGLRYSPEYDIWCAMKRRCHNTKDAHYAYYGGRGITVCERWFKSFSDFISDIGRRPEEHLTLERINNDRGYEPDNCKWATRSENYTNRRNRRLLSIGGSLMPIKQVALEYGIPLRHVIDRYKRCWDHERIVTTPVRRSPSKHADS